MIGTAWAWSDWGAWAWNGTDYVIGYPDITVSKASGEAFTLASLDVANWHDITNINQPVATTVTIRGNFVNGGSITQTFDLMATPLRLMHSGNDFDSYTLSGFNNLSSFHVSHNGVYYIALDNLNVFSEQLDVVTVPEPATYTILSAGLVLLSFFRRARKRKA